MQMMKAQVKTQEAELQVLKTDNQRKDAEIQALKTKNETLKGFPFPVEWHFERGQINCGRQGSWGEKTNLRIFTKFQKPYDKAPLIHLSIYGIDTTANSQFLDFRVNLTSVDTDQFQIQCYNSPQHPYYNEIMNINVEWMSIPQ